MAEGTKLGSAGQTAAKSAERVTYRYIDRPRMHRNFRRFHPRRIFYGQSLRLEFGVSRLDDRKPDATLTAGVIRRVDWCCRRQQRPI